MDELAANRVLDTAYAAALDPRGTEALLHALAAAFRSHFADSFSRTHDHARHHGIAIGLDRADYEEQFLGVWSRRNVWGQRRPVRLAGEIVTTREMLPRHELLRSEMYNDYLHPRGLHEGLRLAVWAGEGAIEDISLLRPWSAGPFAAAELRFARMLLPHLQRAATVARRLRGAHAVAEAGLAALESVAHAAYLVERSGRILHMNGAGAALAAGQDGLLATAAGLAGSTPTASLALSRAVLQAAGAGGQPGRSAGLRLPRPSGLPDLLAITQPVGSASGFAQLDPRTVLVVVSDPARLAGEAQGGLPDRLRSLYGLTAAEAQVALDLLAGREVAEIARLRRRSIATIRTHVARLLTKTGTSRQAELLRLLLRIPRVPAD